MQGFDYERARKNLRIPREIQMEAMAAVDRPESKEILPEKLQERESPNDCRKVSRASSKGRLRVAGNLTVMAATLAFFACFWCYCLMPESILIGSTEARAAALCQHAADLEQAHAGLTEGPLLAAVLPNRAVE